MNEKMDTSSLFYHPNQPHFAFSSLGETTPIDILTCKIQQYQRDRVDVFLTPHKAQDDMKVGSNPCSRYLIIPKLA